PLAWTRGVMSMLTPTSRYWNWVLTSGLMPTPPMPGWNDPVATGTRSPIFSEAFCPSRARICGFWISLVSLLLITADKLAEGIVTWKSVAFRLPKVLRLSPLVVLEVEVVVLVVAVVLGVVVEAILLCRVTVALVGGLKPRVLERSLLTCITAMSTITSGRALSRSSTNFSASAI